MSSGRNQTGANAHGHSSHRITQYSTSPNPGPRTGQHSTSLTPTTPGTGTARHSTSLTPTTPGTGTARHSTSLTPTTPGTGTAQHSTTLTPHQRNPLTPLNSRGLYRSLRRIPRQTIYNRKKRKVCSGTTKENDANELCLNSVDPSNLRFEDTPTRDVSPPNLVEDTPTPDVSLPNLVEENCNEIVCQIPQRVLFPGSALSVNTSNIILRSFMCRHHLTHQAKADLLQVLRIHLPDTSQLPSSLYTFQKTCSMGSTDSDPVVTEHHYCSNCDSLLSDPISSMCSDCGTSHSLGTTPRFLTVSIANQLQLLLKRRLI